MFKLLKQSPSKCSIQYSDGCKINDSKMTSCTLNIKFLQNVLERVIATSIKRLS